MTSKTYSVNADIVEKKITPKTLISELKMAQVSTGFQSLDGEGDLFTVTFMASLSTAEWAIIDGIVATHKGAPLSDVVEPIDVHLTSPSNTSRDVPKVAIVESDDPFHSFVSHNLCDPTTWPSPTDSTFTVAPTMGKCLIISKAEVQFTHDVALSEVTEVYFDIWAYNPMDPPNKVLVERVTYASILSLVEIGNAHYTMPPVDGLTQSLTTIQFNYPRAIPLKYSQGLEIRLSLKDHVKVNGTYVSVTFATSEVDEVMEE